ncbi:N-acetylneuraminate 9-O-acetyltransferase-like [Sycon ciliatum]|uniref:N-acetylneuraminate 9-O-acetyltransferase-like n=1 Tax=Sycon ciliatum TaxID=27933 RepID=UPI0031F5FEDC
MMDRETAAKHGLPAPLSTPSPSPVKQLATVVPNREWFPLHPARFLQLMKSLAMVYVMAYLITQRHQWQSMIRDKSKCDRILDGYTVRSRKEGQHDQLDCTPRHFDSQTARTCFRNSRVLFIGDSRIRALLSTFVKYVKPHPQRAVGKRADAPKAHPSVSCMLHSCYASCTAIG